MEQTENTNREKQTRVRRPLFHGGWSERLVMPGSEEQSLVKRGSADARQLSVPGSRELFLASAPEFTQNPLFEEAVSYRWHSKELERKARKVVFSLCSSGAAGWNRQAKLALKELHLLMEKDRSLRLFEMARSLGITMEHVTRAPIVEGSFGFSYQGSQWLMHPVNDWGEVIPFEAHYSKLMLEKTGLRFDRWYVAEELPKPTLTERAREGAAATAGAIGSVAVGFVSLLGAALGGLALLDPALVGVLESRSESGQADWFIVAKWYH